jgi:hypothetical protein
MFDDHRQAGKFFEYFFKLRRAKPDGSPETTDGNPECRRLGISSAPMGVIGWFFVGYGSRR